MRASKILAIVTVTLLVTLISAGCAPTVTHAPPHDAEYQQFQSDRAQRQLDSEQ